jgi:hypothetical protein
MHPGHCDIFCDRQMRKQCQLLIYNSNLPCISGPGWGAFEVVSGKLKRAPVPLMLTRNNFDECRLPGSISTKERVNLPWTDG